MASQLVLNHLRFEPQLERVRQTDILDGGPLHATDSIHWATGPFSKLSKLNYSMIPIQLLEQKQSFKLDELVLQFNKFLKATYGRIIDSRKRESCFETHQISSQLNSLLNVNSFGLSYVQDVYKKRNLDLKLTSVPTHLTYW